MFSDRLNKGFKASVAFFIASVITSGISYITTPVFTRLLSASDFGVASVFFTWLNLIGIVAMFSFGNGVFNNGLSDYPDKRDSFSFSILILSNLITLTCLALVLVFNRKVSGLIGLNSKYIYLMFAVYITQPAYNFWYVRQRFEYKYKASSIVSICLAIIAPVIAIVFMLLFPKFKLEARIFGAEIVSILFYIVFYFLMGTKSHWKINTRYWKYCFYFNLPLIPHYLSMYLLNSCDKLMIDHYVGSSATAYYSVAYSVAALGTIVWAAINGSLVPFTYEQCKEKKYKLINEITRPLIIIIGFVCLLIIIIAPEVVKIMATNEYTEAIVAIPPIIGGVFFQVQYYLYANVLYYYKKTRFVMYASLSAAVLNIVLNVYCINRFGYLAAGYTTLICYMVQAGLDYWAMKTIVDYDIYDMKTISILSLMIIAFSIVGPFIYSIPYLRLIAFIVIILIVIIKRAYVIDGLKTIILK